MFSISTYIRYQRRHDHIDENSGGVGRDGTRHLEYDARLPALHNIPGGLFVYLKFTSTPLWVYSQTWIH